MNAPCMDARARSGLSAEAGVGQVVRGGRSCPSDWNGATGALTAGKVIDAVRPGSATDGTAPGSVAMQQPLAQKWHVVG